MTLWGGDLKNVTPTKRFHCVTCTCHTFGVSNSIDLLLLGSAETNNFGKKITVIYHNYALHNFLLWICWGHFVQIANWSRSLSNVRRLCFPVGTCFIYFSIYTNEHLNYFNVAWDCVIPDVAGLACLPHLRTCIGIKILSIFRINSVIFSIQDQLIAVRHYGTGCNFSTSLQSSPDLYYSTKFLIGLWLRLGLLTAITKANV